MSTAAVSADAVAPERLRVAIHEAGHATMAVLRGHRCDGVKVENDGTGVAFSNRSLMVRPLSGLHGSILQLDREVRDLVEDDIVISLAGPLAVDAWAPPTNTYTAAAATAELERIMRDLEEDETFNQRVTDWEATPPLERRSDVEDVSRAALLWSGSGSAAYRFVTWLYAETQALVLSRDFQRPLAAVTGALVVHGALPGNEVHRLVAASDPFHVRKEPRDRQREAA